MFQSILVGVDLGRSRPLEITALDRLNQETIERSIWLAKTCSAKLQFFCVFNVSEDTLHGLEPDERSHVMLTLEEKAVRLLDELVQLARVQGVSASRGFSLGKPWQEIIRAVLKDKHDLVVVGTRNLTVFRRMLLGNTALKLLRRCPCPVWVIKPGMTFLTLNILVAVDLKPASREALSLGVLLAKMLGATLHILHVVEYPLDRMSFVDLGTKITDRYHKKVRDDARDALHGLLEPTEYHDLGTRCQLHLEDGVGFVDFTIQQFMHVHRIDLLILGTMGHAGLAGVLIGNTAERLLPEVQCSVLAVKPPDFQCPVPPAIS